MRKRGRCHKSPIWASGDTGPVFVLFSSKKGLLGSSISKKPEESLVVLPLAEAEALGLLEQLARDFNVRDPRGPAQRRGEADSGRSSHRSPELAPGKSFSQNTRGANKYGLVVTDVFRREVATKALPDKRTRAVAEIIPDLVEEEGDYVVTTDLGNEFRGLEAALPGGAVHRQKDPTDRNATAVVERAIQKDLAGWPARRDHVDKAAEAYNARPHQAVRVAPEDVETMPAASFRVYRDNAQKFKHNDELTRSRQRRLEEAGAFPASTIPAPVRFELRPDWCEHGSMRSVPRGSGEPVARLTRRPGPLAARQLRYFNSGPTAA